MMIDIGKIPHIQEYLTEQSNEEIRKFHSLLSRISGKKLVDVFRLLRESKDFDWSQYADRDEWIQALEKEFDVTISQIADDEPITYFNMFSCIMAAKRNTEMPKPHQKQKSAVMDRKKTAEDNDEQALKKLETLAEKGEPQAQFDLGMYYATASLHPAFTPTFQTIRQPVTCISMSKALEWWLKAAEQGHIEAQRWVVNCYRFGLGVGQDSQETVKWLQKLADQDDGWGQRHMGFCYACGYGVSMNEAKAIQWWRKAAKNGQPDAEYDLGEAYITGYGGVKENKEKAIKWIKCSAEHGNKQAQKVLGLLEEYSFAFVQRLLKNPGNKG